ncbi:MAG TPA: TerB family tellurite resistance protein [Vicinamibacterales bacterium]|nr:TerB family tellurite resistance protein [Vicinamibacterales bacterium]
MLKSLQGWLGLADTPPQHEPAPLRAVVDALDQLEPARAQYLARFAYLLGRVARADEHISAEETSAMEQLLVEHGGLSADQAMLVVSLAKASSLMFGVTADFAVTQEFTDSTTYEQRLTLARCMFAVAASDERISIAEESELHRITSQLRIEGPDLTAIRLQHRRFLPGLSSTRRG